MSRRQPERAEQAHIVGLLRTLGAQVWTLGTTRRRGDYQGTMQAPGLPDLLAFVPMPEGHDELVAIEVKAMGGRLRREQVRFRECCHRAHVSYVVGDLDEVIAWLIERHLLSPDRVAAYRVPADTRDPEEPGR